MARSRAKTDNPKNLLVRKIVLRTPLHFFLASFAWAVIEAVLLPIAGIVAVGAALSAVFAGPVSLVLVLALVAGIITPAVQAVRLFVLGLKKLPKDTRLIAGTCAAIIFAMLLMLMFSAISFMRALG